MSDFMDFMVVTGAVITGLGLAMSLEWLTLNGLLRLMPDRHERSAVNTTAISPTPKRASVSTINLFPR